MNELAHWIIDVGTGLALGALAAIVIMVFINLADALPARIPLITPAWEAIKRPIQWLVDKISR